MKKCQMHNKKRDKLSYTVMLHYSAVSGGFVCHFLVHLHDFRQWAVQWATQIFFATDMLAPAAHVLTQFDPQPSTQGAANWARWASWQQVPVQQHIACIGDTVPWIETQQGHPAFTGGRRGSCPPLHMHDAAGPATAEQILWTHSGRAQTSLVRSCCAGVSEHKIYPWHHRHQLQCSFGVEEPFNSLHTVFVATTASLATRPADMNCWRDSRAS